MPGRHPQGEPACSLLNFLREHAAKSSFNYSSEPALAHNGVVLAQNDDVRLPKLCFQGIDLRETHNRQPVAGFAEVCCRTIQNNLAGAALTGNGISLKTLTIGHIAAEDLLIRKQADFVHEIAINRHTALVIEIGRGDLDKVGLFPYE